MNGVSLPRPWRVTHTPTSIKYVVNLTSIDVPPMLQSDVAASHNRVPMCTSLKNTYSFLLLMYVVETLRLNYHTHILHE